MNEVYYSEEDKSHHHHISWLISKKEREYFYSFGYGVIFIYLCLVREHLESGGLLGVTSLLTVITFCMWFGTNPIIQKFEVSNCVTGTEPENITQRFTRFSSISNKIGLFSFSTIPIAYWFFVG